VIRVHLDDGEAKLHHTLFGGPPEGRRSWMADVASRVDTSALDLT
jgi:DNA gyrase subunit B